MKGDVAGGQADVVGVLETPGTVNLGRFPFVGGIAMNENFVAGSECRGLEGALVNSVLPSLLFTNKFCAMSTPCVCW